MGTVAEQSSGLPSIFEFRGFQARACKRFGGTQIGRKGANDLNISARNLAEYGATASETKPATEGEHHARFPSGRPIRSRTRDQRSSRRGLAAARSQRRTGDSIPGWDARAGVCGFLLIFATVLSSYADNRVALVIGNSSYASVAALPNPRRDAEAVTAALRNAGFQSVTMIVDAGRETLVKALGEFARQADGADWGLIYFAGQGIVVAGTDYLILV